MDELETLKRALESRDAPRVDEREGLGHKMAPVYGADVKGPRDEDLLDSWDPRLLTAFGVSAWWDWVADQATVRPGTSERLLPVLPLAGFPLVNERSRELALSYRRFYLKAVGIELAEQLWPAQLVPLVAFTGQVWALDLDHPEHGVYMWWLEDPTAHIGQGFESVADLVQAYTTVLQSGLVGRATGSVDPTLGMYWSIVEEQLDQGILSLRDRMHM